MALTRAQVDVILLKRAAHLMLAAELDGTTDDGTNPDLVDPIASTLLLLEYSVADLSEVTDEDLAPVIVDDYSALFDLSELRLLQNILGNLMVTDYGLGPRSEKLGQIRDGLIKRLQQMDDLLEEYGIRRAMKTDMLIFDISEHTTPEVVPGE